MRALDGSWWRPEGEVLQEAKEDAVRLAVYEQERAGIDLLTDGEAQRAAYDRHFLAGLDGIDLTHAVESEPSWHLPTNEPFQDGFEEYNRYARVTPKVVGEIAWAGPRAVAELQFLKRLTSKPVKANVVGPLTLSGSLTDTFYRDREALIMALARALNHELKALEGAGVDVLQIDEPGFHFDIELARSIGREAIAEAVKGLRAPVIVHVCYGYAFLYRKKSASTVYPELLELLADCPIEAISIEYEQPRHEPALLRHCGAKHVLLGLLDLGTQSVESPEHVAERLVAATSVLPPERLHPSSDCGMWFLPRPIAFAKISSLVQGTKEVRRRLGIAAGN
jgi:5-methyltetrahydropteroyltriglutamate--homocysteine methyltransferase